MQFYEKNTLHELQNITQNVRGIRTMILQPTTVPSSAAASSLLRRDSLEAFTGINIQHKDFKKDSPYFLY